MTDWKALVRARIGPLAVDPAREADIVDELAQHVAEHHKDLVASGVDDAAALAIALAPLSSPPEGGHHVQGAAAEIAKADRPRTAALLPPAGRGRLFTDLARDVRYAVRLLRRAPGFAAAAIVTLALGIGANTAIFSVVRAVVLRPPPYRDPARLVTFLNSRSGRPGSLTSSSLPDYQDWERQLTSFERFGLLSGWTFNITGLELPERVFGARVNGSLFPVLGTPPLFGRVIEPDDDRAGTPEVVVLGYRVWQRLFADYWVVDRTREIGVRMALGASRRGIRAMVVARALGFTAIGVVAGAALSLITNRMLSTLLFDVRPFDLPTTTDVAVLVLITGAAAAYIPARRASILDPLTVIRGE